MWREVVRLEAFQGRHYLGIQLLLWIIIHTDSPQLIPISNAEFSVQWEKYRILVLERKLENILSVPLTLQMRNPKFKLFIAYFRSYDTASLVNIPNFINILTSQILLTLGLAYTAQSTEDFQWLQQFSLILSYSYEGNQILLPRKKLGLQVLLQAFWGG